MEKRCHFFTNGKHSVDFVLAYKKEAKPEPFEKRNNYEANLEAVGLILEKEESGRIHFVKVHVPRDVLSQYAEILKLRLPIKDELIRQSHSIRNKNKNKEKSANNKILDSFNVRLDPDTFAPKKYRLTAPFSKEKIIYLT